VPAGVVVLEARGLAPEAISRLVRLAALAGPVLSLRAELDASRREADRLRHERDRLTIMMDALPDPVLITDGANNILVQNHRAEHLLTARDADSPGRHRALELNNLLFTSGLARAVMSGGARTEPRELNLVDPDEGADLLFELLAHPLTGDAERDDAVLSVLRDVTDLRRAAHELQHQIQRVRRAEIDARKERDRLNLILENVADPILVTDSQAKIILMNEQAEQLFEIGGEAASYAPAAQQAVQRNDTKFTTFVSEFALSDDASRHERMTLDRPLEGNELPVEVVSGKIHNERGEPVAIVSVLHDLTKQVENERLYRELKAFSDELEARVRAATADLAAQNEQLKWQSQEVERANKLKSEFMASMSHELRTPINAIIGHSSLILDEIYGPVAPRQEDALRRIRAAAQDLLALITDILDLAKIEAGKMSLHLDRVDLGDVLAELGQQIEPMLQKRGLEFQVSVAPDTPTLATDRQKVKQILANLLSNAVKFTQRGRVTVTVEPVPGAVQIAVADTGIGILPEDLDVIWEDFRQVDQSKTREVGGTGLGLSIVRKLLDRLDGTVSVTSTYGVGSVFTVVLPLAMRVEEAGETFAPA
jgi:PAS domain S-box-containing protein